MQQQDSYVPAFVPTIWTQRVRRSPEAGRTAILALLAIVAGLALGLAMTVGLAYAFVVTALGIGVAAVSWRCEALILVFVLLTSTIVDESLLPNVGLGAGSLKVSHIVLVLLAAMTFAQVVAYRQRIFASPFNLPILLFCFLAVVETGWGILALHASVVASLIWLRTVLYYGLFFVVVNMVVTKERLLFLVRGVYGLGVFVACAMIVQAVLGTRVQIVSGRVEDLTTFGNSVSGVTRILPPGQFLVQFSSLVLICRLALNQHVRARDYAALIALVVSILLMFGRAETVAIGSVLLLLVLVVPGPARRRIGMFVVKGGSILAIALVVLIHTSPAVNLYVTAFTSRLATVVQISEYQHDSSLNSRKNEDAYALRAVLTHPLMGVGMGGTYRDPFPEEVGLPPDQMVDVVDFIHNGYLMVQLKLGSGGSLLFVFISVLAAWRGLRYWRRVRDPYFRAVLLGGTLTYLQFLPRHFFTPVFMYPYGVAVVALMLGINELILVFDRRDAVESAGERPAPVVTHAQTLDPVIGRGRAAEWSPGRRAFAAASQRAGRGLPSAAHVEPHDPTAHQGHPW